MIKLVYRETTRRTVRGLEVLPTLWVYDDKALVTGYSGVKELKDLLYRIGQQCKCMGCKTWHRTWVVLLDEFTSAVLGLKQWLKNIGWSPEKKATSSPYRSTLRSPFEYLPRDMAIQTIKDELNELCGILEEASYGALGAS